MDILYERTPYFMPSSAKVGDKVYILTTGAYTRSYSSIYFNGFPPLKSYVLQSAQDQSSMIAKEI